MMEAVNTSVTSARLTRLHSATSQLHTRRRDNHKSHGEKLIHVAYTDRSWKSWRWRRYVRPKRSYLPPAPHGVIIQKTSTCVTNLFDIVQFSVETNYISFLTYRHHMFLVNYFCRSVCKHLFLSHISYLRPYLAHLLSAPSPKLWKGIFKPLKCVLIPVDFV
jgi:hypothetical protein